MKTMVKIHDNMPNTTILNQNKKSKMYERKKNSITKKTYYRTEYEIFIAEKESYYSTIMLHKVYLLVHSYVIYG